MTIGEKIRQLRKAQNLTQKQLGELSGIAEPTIRRYELGKLNPKRETILKIAKALNAHPVELSDEIFDSTLLSLLKINFDSDDEFREAFLSKKVTFARLDDDTDQKLFQFYDMLNDYGRQEAVGYIFDLTQQAKYLKDIYTKSLEELKKLQENNMPIPLPSQKEPPQD